MLAHYDNKKNMIVSYDATPYGVGAVLVQLNEDGNEAPISLTSRTLKKAERNYSQLNREGLAVVFAMQCLHQYVAERHKTITTDHQPLLGIMGPKSPVPAYLSPRVTQWWVKLVACDYKLAYRAGKHNQKADALSRLPLEETEDELRPP